MANTTGHTMRRYMGHKLYLAMIAQRKAIMLADDGADPTDVPFWADAPEPEIEDTCDVGDLAYYDDLGYVRSRESALLASALRCLCTDAMRAEFECCAWCELSSIYSDVYKERNGIRPRHHAEWSAIDLNEAIRWYYANPIEPEIEEEIVPLTGEGWTLITAEPEGARERLANDWYRG